MTVRWLLIHRCPETGEEEGYAVWIDDKPRCPGCLQPAYDSGDVEEALALHLWEQGWDEE